VLWLKYTRGEPRGQLHKEGEAGGRQVGWPSVAGAVEVNSSILLRMMIEFELADGPLASQVENHYAMWKADPRSNWHLARFDGRNLMQLNRRKMTRN
jgi:hypothetical protein